jgi:hypothetical protein
MSEYANLEKCCGGTITAESILTFRRAMVEYETFIDRMSELLAPGGMTIEIINGTEIHDVTQSFLRK